MLVPLFFVFLSVMTACSSLMTVVIPPDTQLPLIARVNQPFSWSMCNRTFGPVTGDNGVIYSTSSLPAWLSFDPATLTFHGTPSGPDEGNPEITVTASDSSTSASSTFTLCVTPFPPPTLRHSISEQFTVSNPALSSVFVLASGSALATTNPTLRIPPLWSFSVGFLHDTCSAENGLYYDARQSDGSPIPEWAFFNSEALTLNGIAPNESITLSLALHVSDQEGYTASTLPFALAIAPHELSIANSSLPTINVTALTSFNLTFSSPADLAGVWIDGKPIQPSDVTNLAIDVSAHKNWLKYDQASRRLYGDLEHGPSPGQRPILPVILESYNQSIQTEVALAIVKSYFLASSLAPIRVTPGDSIHFDLTQQFSNATGPDDVKLCATFEPAEVEDWLYLKPETGELTGTMPLGFSSTHITVGFTAYSHVTHSTSHTTLPIIVLSDDRSKKGSRSGGLSAAAHKKLVLGLNIAFGVVGGLSLIGGLLAAFRRCAKVEDTATGGEEGRNVWSDQDKRWYGLDKAVNCRNYTESGPPRTAPDYGHLGLGLRRVSERSQSEAVSAINSPTGKLRSPGVMSKREFITRIRETVRIVSNKAHGRRSFPKRPVIGKPILGSPQPPGLPTGNRVSPVVESPSNPFDRPDLPSHPGSTIMTNSPSASTAEHSIPRRRADFAPPRSPAQVHLEDNRLSRQLSIGSTSSLASNASARTHAAEAVVQTASKAISIRSGKSGSGISQSAVAEPAQVLGTRPRLVPFTSAARVPIPRRPSSPFLDADSISKRVASQTATVWKSSSLPTRNSDDATKSGSGDELKMGLHYMRSLDSSYRGESTGPNIERTLVRIGEKFNFRVPVPHTTTPARRRVLDVKLISGDPLPRFLHVDMSDITRGVVAFFGVPTTADLGEMTLGVYTDEAVCVSQIVLEVVKWR